MTGTSDLSRAQLDTLVANLDAYGGKVERVVIRPVTEQLGKAISVRLYVLGYGFFTLVIERDGSVTYRSELDENSLDYGKVTTPEPQSIAAKHEEIYGEDDNDRAYERSVDA